MQTSKIITMTILALCAGVTVGRTDPDHEMSKDSGSKELQMIKALEGQWEATTTEMESGKDSKPPQKVTAEYHVTSGGSAVTETLFKGTPHEMVSVFHDENGQLAMTHYCMMRNQPHMRLKKASTSEISLEVGKNGGVDPKSAHMHGLTLQMPGSNQLIAKWSSFEAGKEKEVSTFKFTRKN